MKSYPTKNRLLYDFDKVVYSDINLLLPQLYPYRRVDNGVEFKTIEGNIYRLVQKNTQVKHPSPARTQAEYWTEINPVTGLLHQYKVLRNCAMYHKKVKILDRVIFIIFDKTILEEEPEYLKYQQTNWKEVQYDYA